MTKIYVNLQKPFTNTRKYCLSLPLQYVTFYLFVPFLNKYSLKSWCP